MHKGEVNHTVLHKVEIIESEQGWGSKVDEIKYFDSKENAISFCNEFNKDNISSTVPDWYMQANYIGKV